jgi:hypothetical protein
MPAEALFIHVTRIEIMDTFGFHFLLPLVDEIAAIRFDALNKLWIAISGCRTVIPAKDIR